MLLVDPLPYEPIFSPFARSIARFDAPNLFFIDHFDLSTIRSLYAAFPASIPEIAQSVSPTHPWHDPLVILRKHTSFKYHTHFYAADRISELESRIREGENVEWI